MQPTEHALKYTLRVTGPHVSQPGSGRIVVIGIGGAGNNTVTRIMESGIASAECIAVNTDANHLQASKANQKILIGEKLTKGLGVGGDPKLGRTAIKESSRLIEELLTNVDIAFITAGLGGGTTLLSLAAGAIRGSFGHRRGVGRLYRRHLAPSPILEKL